MFMADSCRDIPFLMSEVSRVSEKLSAYQKHRRKLLCKAADRIVREECSSGGDCLRQGYYHPSIIADIVVGGVKRGKLLKRITARSKPNFRYGFDADDRLIYAESPYNREVIIHEGQTDIGLSFDKADNVADGYSEALYDKGRLQTYAEFTAAYVQVDPVIRRRITECRREEYTYTEEKMIVDWYDCFFGKKGAPIFSHDRYIFCVENGLLKTYTVYEYGADGYLKDSVGNGRQFDVYRERKI